MLRLADAQRIIAAAQKKAAEIGQPMNIAVADAGGNLVAHVRMDDAWIGSIDISIKKAYTSRAFDIATKDLATHSQSGGQFFGIHASNDGRIRQSRRTGSSATPDVRAQLARPAAFRSARAASLPAVHGANR